MSVELASEITAISQKGVVEDAAKIGDYQASCTTKENRQFSSGYYIL